MTAALPASFLVPLHQASLFEVARYLYTPSIGVALSLASAWNRLRSLGPRTIALAGALALAVFLRQAGGMIGNVLAWSEAGGLAARVERTLRHEAPGLPAGSVISCGALPDNVRGAYAYRNGCENQVRLTLAASAVSGTRDRTDSIPTGRGQALFELSADGTTLRRIR